jgi:MFS family permease
MTLPAPAAIDVTGSREKHLRRIAGTLGKRSFRLFWIGESTSQIGTAVSSVAIPLAGVRVLHAGTFAIALLTAAAWLPWLLFGLPAGAWVDRLSKRSLMIICDLVSLTLFAGIAISAWLKVLTITELLVAALLAGLVSVFFKAAFQAYIPHLLEKHELVDGNAKLQASTAFANVSGPGIGGAVVQFLGVAAGVVFDAVSFAVSAVCLLAMPSAEPDSKASKPKRELGREIRDGLRFLIHDPYLLPLAAFTSTLCLGLSGTDALLIVFFVRTLGVTSSVTGVLLGLAGVGGLLGAVVSARLVRKYGSARAMLISRIMLSFALLVPLATRGVGLIFSAGWLLACVGLVSGNIISLSFRQARCPAQMLGRVSATYYTMTYSSMALGGVFAGALGTFIGVRPALWVTCGIVAFASVILFFSPIRRLRELPERATLDHSLSQIVRADAGIPHPHAPSSQRWPARRISPAGCRGRSRCPGRSQCRGRSRCPDRSQCPGRSRCPDRSQCPGRSRS